MAKSETLPSLPIRDRRCPSSKEGREQLRVSGTQIPLGSSCSDLFSGKFSNKEAMIDGYPWGQGRLWLFMPYIPHWYLRDSMPSEKIKDFPDSSSKQQPP